MRLSKRERLLQALNSWEEGLARLAECIVTFQRIEEMLGFCISTMIGRSRKIGEIVTARCRFAHGYQSLGRFSDIVSEGVPSPTMLLSC